MVGLLRGSGRSGCQGGAHARFADRSSERLGRRPPARLRSQRPSSFLARGTSALATSVVPVMRRVTLEDFFSRLCRLPAFSRRILPEPVTRNRLLAPECVLFFGMVLSSS